MRCLAALFAILFLAGCPSSTPPTTLETPETTETSGLPETSLTPEESTEPDVLPADFAGVWTTTDTQGRNFDIVVFPNGQAVTNRTTNAMGERGFWRIAANGFLGLFDDGWTHRLEARTGHFLYHGTEPGTPLDANPDKVSPATRVDEAKAPFVGIWRMNKEPDGSYLYLALQSNGQALSTINGGTQGQWELTPRGALCTWPDGWVDLIERVPGGWQKRSWVGAESESPADLSKATRVGEEKFEITP